MEPKVELPANVVRVVDGDTVDVKIECEFRVRLLDCWAPERYSEDGKRSKQAAKDLLPEGSKVLIVVPLVGVDQLQDVMSFGRVLGRIRCESFGDISDRLVEAGFATRTRNG